MGRGFFICWIMSALLMYFAFYIWHGILLTDFYRISYPKTLLMLFSSFTYLVISLVNYFVFHRKWLNKRIPALFWRGIATGIIVGGSLFMITSVIGISFSTEKNLFSLLVDFSWQIFEQSIGGITIALVEYILIHSEAENHS